MTRIAFQEYLDGRAADWMERVSDEQYLAGIKSELKETLDDYLDE